MRRLLFHVLLGALLILGLFAVPVFAETMVGPDGNVYDAPVSTSDAVSCPEETVSGICPSDDVISSSQELTSRWGTGSYITQTIPGVSFVGRTSSETRSELTGNGDISSNVVGTASFFSAPVYLPSGAKIMGLELNYYDNDPSNDIWAWLFVCPGTGASCSSHPISSSLRSGEPSTSWSYIYVDISTYNITINNQDNVYLMRVRFDNGTSLLKLKGVIVYYKLQVSPAPATATFTDVPTTHPFFQYIEALVDAGITSGCAAGMYCPDATLTRGQMAVFLSRALGLHWPN